MQHSEATKAKLRALASGKGSTPEKEAERIRKIKTKAHLKNGGKRQGAGRGKKGWYRSFFCDSSWELAFVVYHLYSDLAIQRCQEVRYYIWEGKSRQYFPDFIIYDKIVEIKGYKTLQ